MPHVVTSGCINCKYSDCVSACPTDSFHEGPNMLVIDPDNCIDCGFCEPACPENAIFADVALSPEEACAVEINARLSRQWPSIVKAKAALPDAPCWHGVAGKWELLQGLGEDAGRERELGLVNE